MRSLCFPAVHTMHSGHSQGFRLSLSLAGRRVGRALSFPQFMMISDLQAFPAAVLQHGDWGCISWRSMALYTVHFPFVFLQVIRNTFSGKHSSLRGSEQKAIVSSIDETQIELKMVTSEMLAFVAKYYKIKVKL